MAAAVVAARVLVLLRGPAEQAGQAGLAPSILSLRAGQRARVAVVRAGVVITPVQAA